ncbi:hypothetical protein HG537_0D05380 [Torulaspora globosa]|uniref:Uncharacterized protein n=1 Tax=Torulaspora globosa TaxID=48254 RepID=A0A7H9HUW2_9SACH|nr:hypothetical protein HG537_0D05380 [Torulaspora sp. CBS 2947]
MLRRPPTTLQLSQDDVAELIAELEEEKLQLRIQSQRKNLTRSSARLEPDTDEGRKSTESTSIDSSFQISPLDGKRLQPDPTDGAPSASVNWANRQPNANAEGNPFYNSQS